MSKHTIGRCPKSREEALANPIKVIGVDWKATNENLRKGYLEPYRFILNRPQSLEFDLGISIKSPSRSGELICEID